MGTGSHLHAILKSWGFDYTPSCSCKTTVADMDNNTPQWSRDNIRLITGKMRSELKNRGWIGKIAAQLPGILMPVRWMIMEAARRAEADLQETGSGSK